MNKRLTELISQAQKEVWGNNPYNGSPEFEGYELDAEKFAELIVRECLEQIDKIRDGCEDDGEDQQALGADWAGLAVARYFGVEE